MNTKTQESVQKSKKNRQMTEKEAKEAFRVFFVKLKKQLSLSSSLENVIWMHLKATGNDKPENFKKGVQNFGYNI